MSTDLVKRLRTMAADRLSQPRATCEEAADRIEALEAENERLYQVEDNLTTSYSTEVQRRVATEAVAHRLLNGEQPGLTGAEPGWAWYVVFYRDEDEYRGLATEEEAEVLERLEDRG